MHELGIGLIAEAVSPISSAKTIANPLEESRNEMGMPFGSMKS